MARPLRAARAPGFTLVEVLVALLIMAVIAALGWQGVASMARTREITRAASDRTLRLSAVIGQWEQDLQAVVALPPLSGFDCAGDALRLLRRSDDAVQVVVWALREGRWQRWASPVTTRALELQRIWQATAQHQGREPGQVTLFEGVTDWQVYRIVNGNPAVCSSDTGTVAVGSTGTGAGSGTGTGTNPAATATAARTPLPAGVRLQIDLPEGRLTRDVALPPQPPT